MHVQAQVVVGADPGWCVRPSTVSAETSAETGSRPHSSRRCARTVMAAPWDLVELVPGLAIKECGVGGIQHGVVDLRLSPVNFTVHGEGGPSAVYRASSSTPASAVAAVSSTPLLRIQCRMCVALPQAAWCRSPGRYRRYVPEKNAVSATRSATVVLHGLGSSRTTSSSPLTVITTERCRFSTPIVSLIRRARKEPRPARSPACRPAPPHADRSGRCQRERQHTGQRADQADVHAAQWPWLPAFW